MNLQHGFILAMSLLGTWIPGSGTTIAAEIPVNIGVGPAAYYVPEKLQEEDPEPFYGLKLHIKAVIDKNLIKKHKSKIPPKYQKSLEKVDEIRVGYLLIPESIMIGTRRKEHGPEFFGASWRPVGLNVPVKMGPARLSVGTGLLITYAFVNTGNYKIIDNATELEEGRDREPEYRDQITHFLRPGMDLNADFEVKFSESFLMSAGWSSAYYIPQKIGGGIGTLGADRLEHSLWRMHQAYVMAHYRIPVTVRL